MPTPNLGGALLSLYHEGIWGYPAWQELSGCIIDFERLDCAKFPESWSQDDILNVKSYVDQHKAQRSDLAKNAFAASKSTTLPGRKLWNSFIAFLWKKTRLHLLIARCLADNNCHPSDFAVDDTDHIATGSMYIPLCLDDMGLKLFGLEAFDQTDHLRGALRPPTQALALRTWTNVTKSRKGAQKSFDKQEEKVLAAFEGTRSSLSPYRYR